MAKEVTDSDFNKEVLESSIPVVVDFWAEWCGPCKNLSPIIDELAEQYNGKISFVKVDVDSNPGITTKFCVRNIPTILFIKNAIVEDKQVGAISKSVIISKAEALLR